MSVKIKIERESERLESFRRAKKTLVCFSLFARAQANAHVHFERERERELKTKKKEELRTSERLRERALPRCRDLALSLDKVVDV